MASGKLSPIHTILSGDISSSSQHSLKGVATGSGGTADHNRLTNRDKADQHPIEAITDLRKELDSKLDSNTALPLIEEAVKNKAKGLYFDAAKELAKKSYWYLTAEIDPKTNMGTKDSIISGPYDLGAGGGSGGGVTKISIKPVNWPSTVVVGSKAVFSVTWSSTVGDAQEPTGDGTFYVSVNDKQVLVLPNKSQGVVELDLSDYLIAGANSIQIKVLDAYGTTGILVRTTNAVTLELKSSFNDALNFKNFINYTYIPYGDVEKTVHFIVDGKEKGTQVVNSTGEQQTYRIEGLSHGSHTLEVYFTAVINGELVTSNKLFYDLVYYVEGNTTPIIVSTFTDLEQEQYIAFNIPYRVYIDGRNEFEVSFLVNDEEVNKTTVGTSEQYWNYVNNTPGNYKLTIKCGATTKDFNIYIKPTTINVTPVTQDLALALSTQGRNNNEDISTRTQWKDEKNNVECTLTNFNWKSNGWVNDVDGNTVLRVSGDARVAIPYKAFETDFKNSGKTIELEIATSAVRNYSATLISCLDKQSTDFYDTSTSFAEEESRRYTFKVNLDVSKIKDENGKSKLTTGSHVFSYTANGWVLDSEILVNLDDYGISISRYEVNPEGTHPEEYLLIGDNIIVNYTLAARGFYVTPQLAGFRSQQSFISTQYKEDEHVRLSFVVEKNTENRIIWMYINGIASGAMQYPVDDNFRQLDSNIIEIGSNDAILDIYNIRVYDNSLTSKQIVNNWIADTQSVALKAERFTRNDNYNDKNEIIASKLPTGLPYIVWDIQPLPEFKGDKRLGNAIYVDPKDPSRNFTSERAQYNVQGTSSSVYPVKNIRIKFKAKDKDPNFFWVNDNGDTIKKFPITYPGGIGANYFTFKVDYASSEGANNVELTKLYNDACIAMGILTPPQRQNLKVRVGIDGFPVAAFYRDADGRDSFCTKANFNNDKANEDVYGFEEGDESWETTNNSADEAKYKVPSTEDNFGNGFEIRFPDEDDWNGDLTKLKAMTTWVASTNRDLATNEELAEPVTYTYKETILGEDNSETTKEVTKTFTHDTKEYRLIKFRAELADWFNVDSTLFYYVFTHIYLMIDSRAKNAFPTYFKSRQAGDGGDRWFWIPYDMDTAIGIDNKGKLSFDYNLEDIDQLDGADVYNGQDSVMWCNLRDSMPGEIKAMYAKMRLSKLISYEETEKRFEAHQGQWSESIFNEDAKNKYIAPLAKGDNYLEMLQGSKAQQRKWWLYNRFKYMDSKYNAGEAIKDFIQFRAYVDSDVEKPKITITPYADIYATVSYANGRVVAKRAKRNEQIIIENPFSTAETENDQETYIYSASQLKSIGDISGFHPDTVKIGNAIKLQELKVGDKDPNYQNPYLKELTVGGNTLLRSIDARNCVNLGTGVTSAPDLSQCINIEEIYFTGTKIKGIILPDGGNIKKLHLPGTLTSLTIKNQPLLTDLNIEDTSLIESLWLENIPSTSIHSETMVGKMKPNTAVRLIGINETYNSYEEVKRFYDILDTKKGLTADGEITEKAQVTGTIHITTIPYAEYIRLSARFPEVTIEPDRIICTVSFYAADNKTIINRQNIIQGGNASFPGMLGVRPSDWDQKVEWDWEDGAIYDEDTHEFIDSLHKHYNKYYKIENRVDFKPVEASVDFESNIYYKTPEKLFIGDKYYLFTGWDKSLMSIQTDLAVYPMYEEHDRHFAVKSDTSTSLITSMPKVEDVTYGHYAHRSALSELPPQVTLIRWYDSATGETFSYDSEDVGSRSTDIITSNRHLVASWNDLGKPVFEDVSRVDYKTIHYRAVDNVGITAFAVTNTPEIPSEWTQIESTPVLDGLFTVTHAGSWYFWIKDSNNNINEELSFLTCHSISRQLADGITSITLKENSIDIGDFALSGTRAELDFANDFHYEFTDADGVFVNGERHSKGDMIVIDSQKSVTSSISPKSYTINFDLCGRGDDSKAQSQTVKYKQHIARPTEQYSKGFVIGDWYLSYDSGYYSDKWDFANDVLDERVLLSSEVTEITLYAEWVEASMPTTITVNIPEVTPAPYDTFEYEINEENTYVSRRLKDKEITVVYRQSAPEATTISWGDGTEETPVVVDSYVRASHQYSEAGEYEIQVEKRPGFGEVQIMFGRTQENRAVNPSPYITDVDFAFDITTTNLHAFRETKITNLKLTPYMTAIADGAFAATRGITELTIPEGITSIGYVSFQECTKLTKVNFPSTLTMIGSEAFKACSKLKDILSLEHTKLREVNDDAFIDCASIDKVILPKTLVRLGWADSRGMVFRGCNSLSKVIIKSKDLVTMGQGNFCGCPLLKTAGPIGSGCNIEYAWTDMIPKYAFSGASQYGFLSSYLEKITFTKECKTIGDQAFEYCSLNDLVLPPLVERIGANAFAHNRRITSLTIPTTVSYIGYGAFAYCSLADISIFSIQISEQKTVENESPADKAWFWGNPTSYPAATVHLPRSIISVDDARANYGYYWNFISETEYLGWVADI